MSDTGSSGRSRPPQRRVPGSTPPGRKPAGRKPADGKRADGKTADGKPARVGRAGGGFAGKGGKPAERDRSGKPAERDRRRGSAERGRGGKPAERDRGGKPPQRGDSSQRDLRTPEETLRDELRAVRPRHDDPILPDDVQASDLERGARNELKTLTAENAEFVARHLAMAARLIDEDPELAHRHALTASRRAGRIAMVRETLAITAYETGDFALALRELRTYRRISGRDNQVALMVDSERGLGRPDRALELGRSVDRSRLSTEEQVGLAIAMSGARLDLEQPEAALTELETVPLDPARAFSWSPDLFHAYAEVLGDLGRDDEAKRWRANAERADEALSAVSAEDEVIDVFEEDEDEDDQPTA